MSKKTLNVFIGRFRMLHEGHGYVIDQSLGLADHTLVFIGSANRPRSFKNSFLAPEVKEMLERVYVRQIDNGSLMLDYLDDHLHDNDFKWLAETHRKVHNACKALAEAYGIEVKDIEVKLIGFSKDQTSYYLKKFPQWGSVKIENGYTHGGNLVNATDLRRELFLNYETTSEGLEAIKSVIPPEVYWYLCDWIETPEGIATAAKVRGEISFGKEYRQEHAYQGKLNAQGQPLGKSYDPIMTTADSVIICSGHVLLGRRKFNPGKGDWALPGGFALANERIRVTSLREAKQETRISMKLDHLNTAFRFKHVFSDPDRSETRGRIITHVYLYILNDAQELPKCYANDDFMDVAWVPIGLLDPNHMYSDHYWIIQKMIEMIPVD